MTDGLPKMINEGGIGSLYKGLVPLWARQIPYTMMKFGARPCLALFRSRPHLCRRCLVCRPACLAEGSQRVDLCRWLLHGRQRSNCDPVGQTTCCARPRLCRQQHASLSTLPMTTCARRLREHGGGAVQVRGAEAQVGVLEGRAAGRVLRRRLHCRRLLRHCLAPGRQHGERLLGAAMTPMGLCGLPGTEPVTGCGRQPTAALERDWCRARSDHGTGTSK